MAYESGTKFTAQDFIDLKARIKAEMLRRCHTGSLTAYGSTDYDFTTTPATGQKILLESINKIVEPINAINDSGVTLKEVGNLVVAMNGIDAKLAVYEEDILDTTNHHCKASCSGLCSTTCTGSCKGECGNNCQGTCSGSCSGGCYGTCTGCGGCGGTCSGGCNGCGGTCSGGCYLACGGTGSMS